ncbi:MAG: Smr/MutS family protein [Acidobacteriota bacterium]
MRFDLVLKWIRGAHQNEVPRHPSNERNDDEDSLKPASPFPDPIVIEFRDVIDLHAIPPRQVRAVVENYIDEAHRRGARWVRIIHGKGSGVQREMVRSILSRASYVVDYRDAPAESGGWGATVVTLSVDDPNRESK